MSILATLSILRRIREKKEKKEQERKMAVMNSQINALQGNTHVDCPECYATGERGFSVFKSHCRSCEGMGRIRAPGAQPPMRSTFGARPSYAHPYGGHPSDGCYFDRYGNPVSPPAPMGSGYPCDYRY